MKRMRFQIKRILTIFCIWTFVIICFMSAFANAENVSGSGESETGNHAVNLLIKLKILEIGDSSMTTIAVTREDFAVYTANLLGIDTNQISTKRYFSDTDMESYGTYAIERLVEMGVISRANDDKFRPNDKITLNEAIKMMCSATGYGEYAERRGGFPDSYIRCARENSFLITPKNSNELSMTEAAEIIFNAAQAAMFEPTAFSTNDGIKFSAKSENTLLSVYHKVYFGTGLVTGIYGLTTDGAAAEDEKIRISDDNDKTDEYKIAPETATDDFLGDYVKYFYYKESSDSEGEIIYLYDENDDKNIKFSSKDFISYSASEIKYYDADAEKEKSISLKNAIIVYNGVPIKTDINKTFDNIKKGYISIKKSGTNRKRDIVMINDYTNVITSGIDSANLTIYNKLNSKDYFSLSDYETVIIFDSAMNRITFSDIKNGSAVSAAASRDDKELITLIVSNSVMNGTLESVKYENKNLVVSIGGKNYVVDKNYEDEFKAAASVGGSYYYTFDFTDEIVYVSEVSTDAMSFGYILRTVLDTDGFSDGIKIKMINGDAKIEYAELAERVRIDGVAYKDDGKRCFGLCLPQITERSVKCRFAIKRMKAERLKRLTLLI